MANLYKKSLLALFISSSLLLSACNDDHSSSNSNNNSSGNTEKPFQYVNYVAESGYINSQNEPIDILENASSISVMKYKMPNVSGQNAEATALIMYPKGEVPAGGWKVVVWEHGTLGVGDSCAPSKAPFNDRVKPMSEELLAEGYVVIGIDYEGLGTPGIHPYLNIESEANSAIYAMKAFKERYGNKVNGDWMSVGQSQGGQASLGTAEYANNDLHYKGAVAGAPASNLDFIIGTVAPAALSNIEQQEIAFNVPLEQRTSVGAYATLLSYAAYAAVGIKAYEPSFNYLPMFEGRSQQIAQLAEGTNGEDGLCLPDMVNAYRDEIVTFMREDSSRKVMDFPGISSHELANNPTLQNFLNEVSQPGKKPIDKPILVIQGEADTNVPHAVTKMMVDGLKKISVNNQDITMISVPGAGHTQAIDWKRAELVAFIKKHMPYTQ